MQQPRGDVDVVRPRGMMGGTPRKGAVETVDDGTNPPLGMTDEGHDEPPDGMCTIEAAAAPGGRKLDGSGQVPCRGIVTDPTQCLPLSRASRGMPCCNEHTRPLSALTRIPRHVCPFTSQSAHGGCVNATGAIDGERVASEDVGTCRETARRRRVGAGECLPDPCSRSTSGEDTHLPCSRSAASGHDHILVMLALAT